MAEECGRGPGKGQRVPATARSSGRKVTAGDKNHRGNWFKEQITRLIQQQRQLGRLQSGFRDTIVKTWSVSWHLASGFWPALAFARDFKFSASSQWFWCFLGYNYYESTIHPRSRYYYLDIRCDTAPGKESPHLDNYWQDTMSVHTVTITTQSQRNCSLLQGKVTIKAGNKPSWSFKFHNHREGPYLLKAATIIFTFETH